MTRTPWLCVLGAGVLAASCGQRAQPTESRGRGLHGAAHTGGAVVATVDGVAIGRAEIEEAMRATGLDAHAALDRLVAEQLLASEAQKRHYDRAEEVRVAVARAAAQALLARTVEAEVTEESIPQAEIERAYQAQRQRFEIPERRGSVHVLAKIGEHPAPDLLAAATRFIEAAMADFATAGSPEVWRGHYEGIRGRRFDVVAETVPPLGAGDAADPAYIASMFERAGLGLVAHPVVSTFGVHAIVVTSIVPGHTIPRQEADETLRRELLLRRRNARLTQLIDGLRRDSQVTRNEPGWRAAKAIDLERLGNGAR